MRRATLERAKKAIAFMEKGISMTDATKLAKIDTRTFKKALKKLRVRTKRKDRKYYIITEYYKQLIDKFIYLMMGNWSATRSARELHTTVRTMKKMNVVVKGKRRGLITKPAQHRYKLNVYRINMFPIVFYGRLFTRFGNTVTGSWDDGKDNINKEDKDEDYANILWQVDFDPFTSTVTEEDVCEHYPILVMELLRDFLLTKISVNKKEINKKVRKMCINRPKYMSEKMLKIDMSQVERLAMGKTMANSVSVNRLELIFGQADIEFDVDVECGIEDRGVHSEYLSPSDFTKNWGKTVDDGAFEIIVRRKNSSHHYPPAPLIIPFKHDLAIESKLPRKVKIVKEAKLPRLSTVKKKVNYPPIN